jgi:hypothetical protein
MFHSHDTRNKSELFITSHNTKPYEESTAYNSVLLYNYLMKLKVCEIKSVKSTIKFKKILINFLLLWKNLCQLSLNLQELCQ